MLVFLNGEFLPRSEANVSVEDRGFMFGDGVYEVWRVVNGRLFESARHFARLEHGLRELRIGTPEFATRVGLTGIAERLFAENGLLDGEATFYVEVTRGAATRTHSFPPPGTAPTVFAMASRFVPPEAVRATGATAITIADVRWLRCDVKTLQLLPNVLAKQAAAERGAIEGLMVRDGVITEGSHTNIAGVLDGEVRTHPLNNLILPGVTRAVVLELAHDMGIPGREEPIAERDLPALAELFLLGTTSDVMPIVKVNDITIGNGVPGAVARRLQQAFRAHMDASCAHAIA